MKKLKQFLAVVLAAAMLLTLAGCASKDEKLRGKLTGTWACELDISEILLEGMLSEVGDDASLEQAIKSMELGSLMLGFDLIIREDNTYVLRVNSQSVQKLVNDAAIPLTQMMYDYLEATINEICAQADMTMEELFGVLEISDLDEFVLQQMGTTLDTFVLDLLQYAFDESGFEEIEEEGTVTVKSGAIALVSEENTYQAVYDEKADTLTVEEYVQELDISGFTFTRQ